MPNKKFSGTSTSGNFQEALEKAIDNALTSTGVSDEGVKWALLFVRGENGTIVGLNNLTVTIDADLSSQ